MPTKKRSPGRPSLPLKDKPRVLAGLTLLLDKHRTGAAVSVAMALRGHKVSSHTINSVARGDTGPSLAVVNGVAALLGYDPLALTVAEIARRGVEA